VPLLFLFAVGHAASALAAFSLLNTSGALGSSYAVDYGQITCTNDGHGEPYYLEIIVRSLDSSNISVQVQSGSLAKSTTDSSGTDSSPRITVTNGAGPYNVFINSTSGGAHTYQFAARCRTIKNVSTGITQSEKFGMGD
jgi:hypothetical protein